MLQRSCPRCRQNFAVSKKQYEEGGYLNLRCPLCSFVEEFDRFITEEQEAYVQSIGHNELMQMAEQFVDEELGGLFDDLEGGEFVDIEVDREKPEFGRDSVSDPLAAVELRDEECQDCEFQFKVEKNASTDASCPVCR